MVNGVRVSMLTAGAGDPLLYLHGAGTWHGFDFALPWTAHHRVLIPYHPGWGDSGDSPEMTTVHDHVMHTLELIDQLKLDRVDLVGFSMGGRFAATFASEHRRRVRKLVLVAPAGLEVPGHPTADVANIPPEQLLAYLVEDPSVLAARLPSPPDREWQAARDREKRHFAGLVHSGLLDPKFARWLHRVTNPTLIVWGERDRIVPIPQAEAWRQAIPRARLYRVPGAGHLVLAERPEAATAVAEFLRE
jgi:pimeloyl-ACP methyl ester carboxylesterase